MLPMVNGPAGTVTISARELSSAAKAVAMPIPHAATAVTIFTPRLRPRSSASSPFAGAALSRRCIRPIPTIVWRARRSGTRSRLCAWAATNLRASRTRRRGPRTCRHMGQRRRHHFLVLVVSGRVGDFDFDNQISRHDFSGSIGATAEALVQFVEYIVRRESPQPRGYGCEHII